MAKYIYDIKEVVCLPNAIVLVILIRHTVIRSNLKNRWLSRLNFLRDSTQYTGADRDKVHISYRYLL